MTPMLPAGSGDYPMQAPMTPTMIPVPLSPAPTTPMPQHQQQPAAAMITITAKQPVGTGWHRGLLRTDLMSFAKSMKLKVPNKYLSSASRDDLIKCIELNGRLPVAHGLQEYVAKHGM